MAAGVGSAAGRAMRPLFPSRPSRTSCACSSLRMATQRLSPSACRSTVRHRGMGTGISEASKRVPIFPFATQGGKQVSSHFRQRNWVQPERLRSGFLQADLSLIV